METASLIFTAIALVLSIVVVIKLLAAPVKLVFKILINAGSGFLLLIIANFHKRLFLIFAAYELSQLPYLRCVRHPPALRF